MKYDLVVKGGVVIDPSQRINCNMDVGIKGGKVAALEEDIKPEDASEVFDASGKFVTPGLLDIHIHVYVGVTTWGIEADPVCLLNGVTGAVDAGSPGWVTFPGFRELVVNRSRTRVLSFIHISGIGLVYGPVGEMLDMDYAAPDEVAQAIEENRDIAVGVKVRQGGGQVGQQNGVEPLRMAVRAAENSGTPLMVHIGAGVPLPDVLKLLRPGDIVTHCYQGRGDGIIDEKDNLLPEVIVARERGVIFDVGHGAGSFNFDTAKAAFEHHFLPDVISTDLHSLSIGGPVYDFPTTISKFLYMGMSLEDAIEKSTIAPARAVKREDEMGSLKVGYSADIGVFELLEGEFGFVDTHGQKATWDKKLSAVATIRNGNVCDKSKYDIEDRRPLSKVERAMMTGVDPDWWERIQGASGT